MRNPSSKRQAAAQETRKGILEAAKAVYGGAQGAEAPVSHVAKLAGVAVGTVFVHFPDKPSLLAAALEEEIVAALAEAWKTLPANVPCHEQLLHLAGAMYRFYAGRPALYRVLLKETLFLRGEWGRRAVEDVLRFVEGVTALLEASRDRGEYRADRRPQRKELPERARIPAVEREERADHHAGARPQQDDHPLPQREHPRLPQYAARKHERIAQARRAALLQRPADAVQAHADQGRHEHEARQQGREQREAPQRIGQP